MTLFIIILIIFLDQISKNAATKYLKNMNPYKIINNFFELTYVENRGAAFGIFKHKRLFFIIVTAIVIIILFTYLYKNYNNLSFSGKIAISMLIGGAGGNLLDRVKLGYVIDFISFRFFNRYDFPVFNLADVFIVISTGVIALLVLFDKFDL